MVVEPGRNGLGAVGHMGYFRAGGQPLWDGVLALPGRRITADAGANALIESAANGRTRTLAVLPPAAA